MDSILLRAKIDEKLMVYPLEESFEHLPRIGERIVLSGEAEAHILMVIHYHDVGFYYPGTVMRQKGIQSCWGISHVFHTVIDVELNTDVYTEHTREMWHFQMGWDKIEWLTQ